MDLQTNYVPIQNVDLESDLQLSFDLYISLPLNQRVILYRRQGDYIEADRLARLARGPKPNLFIRKEDYKKFVVYVSGRMKRLLDMSTPGQHDTKETREVVAKAVRGMLAGTFEHDDSAMVRSMMENLNDVSSVVIDGVLGDINENGKKTYRRMLNLASNGTDFQKHPVNVASLAVMMAFGSGYSSERTLADVSMAALLHDLGLSKIPFELALKAHRHHAVGLDDQMQIDRHVEMTMEIIKEKGIVISDLTRMMIEQHHEYFNGTGSPRKLRGLQVSPYAQILHMADEIDQVIFGSEGKNGNAALRGLFDMWSRDRAFEPRLLSRIRGLFFSN